MAKARSAPSHCNSSASLTSSFEYRSTTVELHCVWLLNVVHRSLAYEHGLANPCHVVLKMPYLLLSGTKMGQNLKLNVSSSLICNWSLTRHKTPTLPTITVGKLDSKRIQDEEGFVPEDVNFAIHVDRLPRIINSSPDTKNTEASEMTTEELYQVMLGKVVMVATYK